MAVQFDDPFTRGDAIARPSEYREDTLPTRASTDTLVVAPGRWEPPLPHRWSGRWWPG